MTLYSIPYTLGLVGFGPTGIKAGSIVAWWQAWGLLPHFSPFAMAGIGGTATLSPGVASAVGITQFCGLLEEHGLCSPIQTLPSKL